MKEKIMKVIMALMISVFTILPMNFMSVFAAKDYIIVDDTIVNNKESHYFTFSAASDANGETGWSESTANFGDNELKTQHWVWNTNNTEASKHSYTFTFVGTGVELMGITPSDSNKHTFTLNNGTAETLAIDATSGKKESVLYSKKGLAYGTHSVQVTLPNDGNQKGLQISYARVYGTSDAVNEITKILPNKTEGSSNKFIYHAPAGKEWKVNGSNEAYLDLGSDPTLVAQSYYEIPFVGNGIEIFANKNHNHGKVTYSVDGENIKSVDLYNASRTTPQSVYKVDNLKEGAHVLKAVLEGTKSGSTFVNQVVSASISHAPYIAQDIILEQASYDLVEGAKQIINYNVTPDYVQLTDVVFTSSDEAIATVSKTGVISAVKKGQTTIKMKSPLANIEKVIAVNIMNAIPQMGGSFVDTNTQYTQDRYQEVTKLGNVSNTFTGWKNDKVVGELSLFSKDSALKNVSIVASDAKAGDALIKASNIKSTFIKSTKAYNGPYLGYGSTTRPIPYDNGINRSESNDILYQVATKPMDIAYNTLQNVWVELQIPKDAKPGTYSGTLQVSADGIETPLTFTYSLVVMDAFLQDASQFKKTFDIELWQYPYSSAEYYDVVPFSKEHLDIMRSGMLKYKEVSGSVITASILEEAWAGQTYSKNDVHYPSMVKWTKNQDGSFAYDFTDFDKWVSFNKDLGIGDKIVLYSIAPWHNSFTYWENGVLKYEGFTAGSARYKAVWTDFLQKLTDHLMDKGWYEEAYIGIDERGFSKAAFDVIESVKNIHGNHLKTAGSMDNLATHADLAMHVTDLNIGDTSATATPDAFAKLVKDRDAAGLRTALYTCTEHQPGNFSLSSPVESYWMVANDAKIDGDGIMRWAYDAWVEDPLNDATHNSFEPGDCFLIYPDHKDAKNPTSKSSIRLEKIFEGVRDVNKLMQIEAEIPALKAEIDDVYATINGIVATSRSYLSKAKIQELIKQVDQFKLGLNNITQRYIDLKENGTDLVESVEITEQNQQLKLGDSLQLHAVVKPTNVLNSAVTWTTSNSNIATVSSSGVVHAQAMGNVEINAISKQDATKKDRVTLTVIAPVIDPASQQSYYSFDDESAKDFWGTRNGVNNGASFLDGKANKALHISAPDKNITFPDLSKIGENDPWSISYWVNATTPLTQRSSVLMDRNKDYSADLKMADTRDSGFHVGKNSGDVLTFAYPFQQGTWYNVTWTQSKTTGLSMYVNGELVQTNAWTKTNKVLAPIDIIGGTGFVGYIDELKIYNKVLNNEEVRAAMIVNGLNLTETSKNLFIGDTYKIETNLVSDEEDKTITYVSSDPSIASVDEQGNVTALQRGSVSISVENKAGGYKGYVNLTIHKKLNIANNLPVYQLPIENLSDIEKAPGTPRQYLGQPDMVRTKTGRLITAYPIGHGKGPIVMKVSDDDGTAWKEKLDIPSSWNGSQETPTMYTLNLGNGKERIMLITACPGWGADNDGNVTGWNTSYSDDNGNTWSEYAHWKTTLADGTPNKTIVGMSSLVQLKDKKGNDIQKWMAVYHNYDYVNYKTYLTFDKDGNEQWSEPEPYLSDYRNIESVYQICEVGMFRSPDGKRIVGLARSQSHNNPATLIYSDNEGETWSKPMDLPGSLAGERHKATYDPITQRLVITFREIKYDLDGNHQFDGGNDWLAGDWVAWVGTYDDLMDQNEGQYRILLAEDWANNAKSGDTGYAGVVVLEDGTFIMDSYGHWDKDFSLSWQGGVTTDLCYIKQAKFKLAKLDNIAGLIDRTALNQAIVKAQKIVQEQAYTATSWKQFQEALKTAETINLDTGSDQKKIDQATTTLLVTIDQLVKKEQVDKTALAALIIAYEQAIGEGDLFQKDNDWITYIDALAYAKQVNENKLSTQSEVDNAKNNLERAYQHLRLLPTKNQSHEMVQFLKKVSTMNRTLFTKAQLTKIDNTTQDVKAMIRDFDAKKFDALQQKIKDVLHMITQVEQATIDKPTSPDHNGNNKPASPDTGDQTSIATSVILLMLSGLVLITRIKKHNDVLLK